MPKRSILVLNNYRIYKTPRVLEIYQEVGVLLEFLPTYSPKYNPIKLDFAVLKAGIKRLYELASTYLLFDLFLIAIVKEYRGKYTPV